jgi:GNAT superfamily N-acetyltransferase
MMEPAARAAVPGDLESVLWLYGLLESEMTALKTSWAATNGLDDPHSLAERLPETIVGVVEEVVVGFLVSDVSSGTCVIEYIFTHPEARGIGVGDAMLDVAMGEARAQGITGYDVAVLPGHRATKNFFEGEGYKARMITMHHDDV